MYLLLNKLTVCLNRHLVADEGRRKVRTDIKIRTIERAGYLKACGRGSLVGIFIESTVPQFHGYRFCNAMDCQISSKLIPVFFSGFFDRSAFISHRRIFFHMKEVGTSQMVIPFAYV